MRFYSNDPGSWEIPWRSIFLVSALLLVAGGLNSCSNEIVCPQGTAGTPCTPNGDLGSQPEIPLSGDVKSFIEPDTKQNESKDQFNESDTGTDTVLDVAPLQDALGDADDDATSDTSIEDALEKSAEEPNG